MSNKTHLMILNEGIKAWNDWRNDNPEQKPNLEGADLREKNLTSINLIGVNLSKTNISGQNLSKINLTKANLTEANLAKTNLSGADLFMANLTKANLTKANLSGASLSVANFTEVNLSEANLSLTEALNTNFSKSIFTAACIQDWHINNITNLNNVICEYIYLKANHQERRPHDPNRTFAQGDFTRLFQQVRETVDLIFSNGIDWKTFLTAFQKLQIESGSSELSIQAIEKKQDGAFIIRVDTPINTDKEKIESSFWEKYNPLLESKDKEIKLLSQQTDFYSQQVEVIRKDNTRLLGIVE
ncbi:MAG: pentapeptide repeat-containing protein, partial [Cyanobacteria bacterium P01_A01_bin.84]